MAVFGVKTKKVWNRLFTYRICGSGKPYSWKSTNTSHTHGVRVLVLFSRVVEIYQISDSRIRAIS